MLDSLFFTKLDKFSRHILTPTISSQHFNKPTTLLFDMSFEFLKILKNIRFSL
ncbi:hypothetical protein LguiA_020251 [Lonicera macranthoides]